MKNSNVKLSLTSIICDYASMLTLLAIGTAMAFLVEPEYRETVLLYSSIVFTSMIFAYLAQKCTSGHISKVYFILSALPLFLLLGFREFSAMDDFNYYTIFNSVLDMGVIQEFLASGVEPGYLILNGIVGLFTDRYIFMQLVTSFIIIFLFYRGFYKFREYISLPMVVFLFSSLIYFQLLSAGLTRMFIATGIVLNACYYITIEKNIKKYSILIILASLFHYSALFMLIFSVFSRPATNVFKWGRNLLLFGFVLFPAVIIFFSNYVFPYLPERYDAYVNMTLSLSLSSLTFLPIIILIYFSMKWIEDDQRGNYFILWIISIFTLIIEFYFSSNAFGRLVYYSEAISFIAVAWGVKKLNGGLLKYMVVTFVFVYGLAYVYHTQFLNPISAPHLFPSQNFIFG